MPGNWYETGVMVAWQRGLGPGELGLEVAATNGLGAALPVSPRTARQNTDANQDKMLSGRLGYAMEGGFEAGVSFASGKHDAAGSQSYSFLGADLQWSSEDLEVVGEFVTNEVDDPASPGGSLGRQGWYLQAFAPITSVEGSHEFGLYLRAESVDPDDDTRDSADRSAYVAGLRWVPAPHLTFKAEFRKIDHDHAGPHAAGDEFRFQAVLDF